MNSENELKQQSVIATPANQGSDWFFGSINGFLSLFGAGSLIDPLGDARSEYDSAIQNMQDIYNNNNLLFALKSEQTFEDFYNLVKIQNSFLDTKIKQNTQIFNDTIKQENLFMTLLSMIVFIIIFYLLFAKKCC